MTLIPFPKSMDRVYQEPPPRTNWGLLSVVLAVLVVVLGAWLAFVVALTFGLLSFVQSR